MQAKGIYIGWIRFPREQVMAVLIHPVRILFLIAALSVLSNGQQSPCDLSQPTPPRSDPTVPPQDNDVSGRSAQLECVQKDLNKAARELGTKHAAQRAELRAQYQTLKIYNDKLVQLATDLKNYVDQS